MENEHNLGKQFRERYVRICNYFSKWKLLNNEQQQQITDYFPGKKKKLAK